MAANDYGWATDLKRVVAQLGGKVAISKEWTEDDMTAYCLKVLRPEDGRVVLSLEKETE